MADRRIKIRSGELEVWMEVTEESYEAWRDNSADDMGIRDMDAESIEELLEKKMLLGILEEALESLPPEEKELAEKMIGEQVPVSEFARKNGHGIRYLHCHKELVKRT